MERLFVLRQNYPTEGIELYSNPFIPALQDYLILEVVSFKDEYERNFLTIDITNDQTQRQIEPEYWERIRNLKKIVTPIFEKLNRWSKLKPYRNNYVAHGIRSNNDGMKLSIPSQTPFDAPRQLFEFKIMRDLIHMAFSLISQEFEKELNEAIFIATTLKPGVNPCKNNTEIDLELREMIQTIVTEIKAQDKEYSLNTPELHYPGLKYLTESMRPYTHPKIKVDNLILENHREILARIQQEDTK